MNEQKLIKEAENAYQNKAYLEAANKYLQIAEKYDSEDNQQQAAEMRNNASVAFLMANEHQRALDASLGTELVFRNINDKKREAIALSNQAAAYEALGDIDQAYTLFSAASDLFKDIGEKDYRSFVLKKISAIQLKKGKQLEALGNMHFALENAEKLSPREKTLKKLTNWVMRLINRS